MKLGTKIGRIILGWDKVYEELVTRIQALLAEIDADEKILPTGSIFCKPVVQTDGEGGLEVILKIEIPAKSLRADEDDEED